MGTQMEGMYGSLRVWPYASGTVVIESLSTCLNVRGVIAMLDIQLRY